MIWLLYETTRDVVAKEYAMSCRRLVIVVMLVATSHAARADETLYRYEGNVLPYDEFAGWRVFDPCEDPCSESLEDGHFVLRWPQGGDLANYQYSIADPPEPPPPTLWVEWRFRSNHPLGPIFFGGDANFKIKYGGMFELVNMYGDAAISFSGNAAVLGLDIEEFHTYRFESLDGINYRIAVDGQVFIIDADDSPNGYHSVAMRGLGGDVGSLNVMNEWDFVRYGTISRGEQIIASDPPGGVLDPRDYPGLDRFTVTFDSANYVYIDDITVEVTGGDTPVVIQTRRLENGDPETVEIVLDRPLTIDQTTTFTFNDAAGTVSDTTVVNVVEYTLRTPVPTVSAWGMIALTLLLLTAATILLRRSDVPRCASHLGWHGLARPGRDRP